MKMPEVSLLVHNGPCFASKGCEACQRVWRGVNEALGNRDVEWWEQLALVDNVAPEPKAVKKWVLALAAYEQRELRREIAALRKKLAKTKPEAKAVVRWRLVRYVDRDPLTEEKLPEGSRIAWTGAGFVVESYETEALIREFETFADADAERRAAERAGWASTLVAKECR